MVSSLRRERSRMLQSDKEDFIGNTKYFPEGDGKCLLKRRERGEIKEEKLFTQKMNTIFRIKKSNSQG